MYFDSKKVVEGNIIDLGLAGQFDVIVHGCNCFHIMGGGLAKEMREKIPLSSIVDNATSVGSEDKLGKYSVCQVLGKTGKVLTVVNAYTQYRPFPPVSYEAIEQVFNEIGVMFKNSSVAYPRIGAGLAGGDWESIHPLIDHGLRNVYSQTLVEYQPPKREDQT